MCEHTFASSFPISLTYFFFLSGCPDQKFRTILNRSGENGHLCLVPILRGKAPSFFDYWIYRLWVFVDGLYHVEKVPSLLSATWYRCSILANTFSPSIKMTMTCLLVCPIDIMYYIYFQMLNHPFIPGINPGWILISLPFLYYIFFIYFLSYCLGGLH